MGKSTFLAALVLATGVLTWADTPRLGDEIELRARHHLGVPLHRLPESTNDFDRVADGAHAIVREIQDDADWFRLEIADGRGGWIVKRYIGRVIAGTEPTETQDAELVWSSLEGCQQVVEANRRMPKEDPNALLVGSWNIRWFARGCSTNEDCPENRTDVDWLACAITWTGVDLIAVQEILTSQTDQDALNDLLQKLNMQTGGAWQADVQSCGGTSQQHVGFLWNSSTIQLTNLQDVWQLNPTASGPANACQNLLRPGRYARAKSANGGADFNIVAVHLDSGTSNRDFQNRRTSIDSIAGIEIEGQALPDIDLDTIVLGDFNTMGREEQPVISASQEIQILDQELATGFQRLAATPACTEYFEGGPGILDHIVASAGMSEAAPAASVTGYCAVLQCSPFSGNPPPAYQRLSDHCPLMVEIANQDDDP